MHVIALTNDESDDISPGRKRPVRGTTLVQLERPRWAPADELRAHGQAEADLWQRRQGLKVYTAHPEETKRCRVQVGEKYERAPGDGEAVLCTHTCSVLMHALKKRVVPARTDPATTSVSASVKGTTKARERPLESGQRKAHQRPSHRALTSREQDDHAANSDGELRSPEKRAGYRESVDVVNCEETASRLTVHVDTPMACANLAKQPMQRPDRKHERRPRRG